MHPPALPASTRSCSAALACRKTPLTAGASSHGEAWASVEKNLASLIAAMQVQGYAAATLRTYSAAARHFAAFLETQGLGSLGQVTPQVWQQYLLWLRQRPYSDNTIRVRAQAVQHLFEHLVRAQLLPRSPLAGIGPGKLTERLPRAVLTRAEARQVLARPDPAGALGARDRALLEVFYSTGIRVGEMAALAVADVDCREGFLRVIGGKGGKDRVVPLGRAACQTLGRYLSAVRQNWASPRQTMLWLGVFPPHRPLAAQAIAARVKVYGRLAGLGKPVTPHVWRHTCATHLVSAGANLAHVQQLLGHASLRTTQIYVRTSIPEIVAMHAKAHPRNQTPTPLNA